MINVLVDKNNYDIEKITKYIYAQQYIPGFFSFYRTDLIEIHYINLIFKKYKGYFRVFMKIRFKHIYYFIFFI